MKKPERTSGILHYALRTRLFIGEAGDKRNCEGQGIVEGGIEIKGHKANK